MTTATLTVKNGAIQLPKELHKAWKDAKIVARISPDTVVLKKMRASPFWESWEKMRPLAKGVSKADVEKAIARARQVRRKKG
ncbi:hypothetical protein A3C21_00145 [Candidatus Kaiserbacteria bacterium RIFCSPHIGHO2_02_FULL_59_21]|uniref:SpoVT-AbrB domain-containing protein n=2 Tax=Candidatus Kaiseribacteriota TaxID=1752734 RepID=A0A0G2BK88_9BACT|nr:MAG: hypothetical protein UY98_C0031G0010 [Candidatus Kaiserbacteria bacterium GW2011_GWA2_58_9]OGG62527.1 MAG: hypothetical protein A2766_00980 [Candidatus Kaiserbacteria bacterium RIFCSPHIGHO2_01_FULL_58_22]OGG67498.1 MAG: hypothetical protein A3C21_00145 [Candidatus Kaiserbacteria bacterium RIFCSPHIGHO2_02_FULL_59_21]OGG80601.1 MAG: hypothetical protein A2952_03245 [Candidatus Kaiserbacteria bacterium RIFCSPLOWO2_01_FULL_59_34]OGG86451.1 MAG: hypothetical protein A3I47_03795 [Candidatus K